MQILIRSEPFDPWREIVRHQEEEITTSESFGATAVFVGTMRDFNESEAVSQMTLEHYPEMTERHLRQICEICLHEMEFTGCARNSQGWIGNPGGSNCAGCGLVQSPETGLRGQPVHYGGP